MKYKLITLYIALFWFAIFVAGLWVSKAMIQAWPPDIGVGFVGGVLYALIMRAVWAVLRDALKDLENEWREQGKEKEDQVTQA